MFGHNGCEVLKSSGTGGNNIMTTGRKTTFDERIEIVQYCIAHDHNYAETAEEYQVSYQQARNYTIKYESKGVEALKDNRGKRKSLDSMSELEKLRAEVKILRAEKEHAEIWFNYLGGILKTKDNLLVAGIMRGNKLIVPSGDDFIKAGDSVIIVTTNSFLTSLEDILA